MKTVSSIGLVFAATALIALSAVTTAASAADKTTVTCFTSATADIAGVNVAIVPAGAAGGTHLPCGYWFSTDWYEHYHARKASTVATAWTFTPLIRSAWVRILYNADSGVEKYTLIAKDAAGNQVGSPIVYDNKDEAGKRFDFPVPVARIDAFHAGGAGALALLNFGIPSNNLQVHLSGDGSVTSDIGGIDCGVDSSNCEGEYADLVPSSVVTLTASPDSGQTFSGWTGDCDSVSGSACTTTMDKTKSVRATFTGPSYGYLAVDTDGQGKVTSSPAGIDIGLGGTDAEGEFVMPAQVTLSATPDSGWHFVRWEGDRCSGHNPKCLIDVDDCLSVKAVFAKNDVKISHADTPDTEKQGTRSVRVGYRASGNGLVRLSLFKCSGSNCRSKRLRSIVTVASSGVNKASLRTAGLKPGRYRVVASTARGSSVAYFTVPSATVFTG